MTIKDLMKGLEKLPSDMMVLTGEFISKKDKTIGWDNIELYQQNGNLYIMSCGEFGNNKPFSDEG